MEDKVNIREEFETVFAGQVRKRLEAANISMMNCRGCDSQIFFMFTDRGRKMPMDLNLTPHWKNCPMATKFNRSYKGGRDDRAKYRHQYC